MIPQLPPDLIERMTRMKDVKCNPCLHFGNPTGDLVDCVSCNGKTKLKVFGCVIHSKCVPTGDTDLVKVCISCTDRNPGV